MKNTLSSTVAVRGHYSGDEGLIEVRENVLRENGLGSKNHKVAGKLKPEEAFKIMEAHWNKKTDNFWETD